MSGKWISIERPPCARALPGDPRWNAADPLERARSGDESAFAALTQPHRAALQVHCYGVMVLTLRGDRVSAITGFVDSRVFASFGLPRTLRE